MITKIRQTLRRINPFPPTLWAVILLFVTLGYFTYGVFQAISRIENAAKNFNYMHQWIMTDVPQTNDQK